ncbi:MAG: asparaginase domain-containing protein [Xanthomonadaceae bacterium]|nr:asparaginase domain-containing protein [Xanthomonadaceae bacterium]
MTEAIRVFTTGGTIDKLYFDENSEFEIGEPQVGGLLREAEVQVPFTIEALMRKDSLHVTDDDRALIRARVEAAEETRILITHGTDTMADTARALAGIPGKIIVLTGALHPARFRHSDAEFNVGMALAAVQVCAPGVWVAINGRVFDGLRVRKDRAANRFEPT